MFDWRYWLIVAAWAVWELYWAYSARGIKRATQKEPWISRGPILVGLILAMVLLLAPDWLGSFMGQRFLPASDAIYFSGFALPALGVYWGFWARHALGTNWSGRVTIKEGHELVTAGPYRWVRHPIYTGVLFAYTGSVLALGCVGGLFAIAIMLAICMRKIWLEEKMLDQHFGTKYADYRRTTKALIPLVW